MGAVEEFDFGTVGDLQIDVEELYARVFGGDHVVWPDSVAMASFDHEGARADKRGHFGIVERAAQIELEDLVLARSDIRVRTARGRILPDPFIEVGRADRKR